MPEFRRAFVPGGTFFFTVVTAGRARFLSTPKAVTTLRAAIDETNRRFPFTTEALVVLPDHLHTVWTLPENDADFSTRWALIKKTFTKAWLAAHGGEMPVSDAKRRGRRRGVWQRRFWEHTVRDDRDFQRHVDYIHYNPVKHGLVRCPHAWQFSTFLDWVGHGVYEPTWQCACERSRRALVFEGLAETAME